MQDGKIYMPGPYGVFVDALANECELLTLIAHQAKGNEIGEADFALRQKNINWINLGEKSPSWYRAIFHKKILGNSLLDFNSFDAVLVRSPTPLAPYFRKYIKKAKLVFMVVGDYADGAMHYTINSFRDRIIQLYLLHNDYLFRKELNHVDILVNSPELFDKYANKAKSIQLIKTTTLSLSDFFDRDDTCQHKPVQLLYTGRIDLAKGLKELVQAVAELNKEEIIVQLNIAGWETDGNKTIELELLELAKELNISDSIRFHGRKKIGEELNEMYRMSDIYVLPSYHEGFPRTIWEAMANSLPVIATEVGGIPSFLKNQQEAYFIQPKSVSEICMAVNDLIQNKELRMKIIANGRELAKENTLEVQSKKIVNHIQQLIKNE